MGDDRGLLSQNLGLDRGRFVGLFHRPVTDLSRSPFSARCAGRLAAGISKITSAATLFGACSGLTWMARRGGFNASGPFWKRGARCVVGFIGVLVLYAGLKAIFPSGDTFVAYVFRYIRYTFVGFWISGGATWTFAKLNLTESHEVDLEGQIELVSKL